MVLAGLLLAAGAVAQTTRPADTVSMRAEPVAADTWSAAPLNFSRRS